MVTRLILALLLAAFAIPAGAGAPACHDVQGSPTTHAMSDMPAAPDHKAMTAHVCIGCIPPSDWIGRTLAGRLRPGGTDPVAGVMRLDLLSGWPPALPPPRMA